MFVRATTIWLDYYYKSRKSKALSEKEEKEEEPERNVDLWAPFTQSVTSRIVESILLTFFRLLLLLFFNAVGLFGLVAAEFSSYPPAVI